MTKQARTTQLDNVHHGINTCLRCPLALTRTNPVPGEGPIDAVVMLIGEAPGRVNDETGRPFVGHGGKILDSILQRIGLSRQEVFITNSVKCWPPDNRKPLTIEVSTCKTFLDLQIDLIRPKLIVALGGVAFRSVTGKNIKLHEQHGILFDHVGASICATYHPNGIRYIRGGMNTIVADLNKCLGALGITTSTTQRKLFNETEP